MLRRMQEALGNAPWLARWQERDIQAWPTRVTVLVFCLLLHAGFWWRLQQTDVPTRVGPSASAHRIELVLIPTQPAPPPAIARETRRGRVAARSLRTLRLDPPTTVSTMPEPESPEPPVARSLSEQISGLGSTLGEIEGLGMRDPLHPRAARLPGRATPIVGGFHVRRERSIADVVAVVGGLFGGNYDPCPDLKGKLHDATIAQPERYSDAERDALVKRELRCRY